jgi:hypothetical protein
MDTPRNRHRRQRVLNLALLVGAVTIASAWLVYGLFGHRVVAYAHGSDSEILGRLMSGRAATPLQSYLDSADTLMLAATLRAIPVLILLALLKRPAALVRTAVSCAVVLLVVITALEAKPSLAYALGLGSVDYYRYQSILEPDAELVYRSKPLLDTVVRQPLDPRLFGIEASPAVSQWTTDREGFRNARAVQSCDVVLIGDGMLNFGRTLPETFGSKIEKHLGRCVANLGVSGHGPFQYVRTFERYGIPKRPAYAVLVFNEGNDIQDIDKHNAWNAGSVASFWGGYEIAISNPVIRVGIAVRQTLRQAEGEVWRHAASAIFKSSGAAHPLAGDLAWVRLPTQAEFPIVFLDRQQTRPAESLQTAESWDHLRRLLSQFRTVCAEHGITPVLVFVPTAAHIYAEYSTDRSGAAWLEVRDEQIHAKENLEIAFTQLSNELGFHFISLTAPFEQAATNGGVLYELFSAHLAPEGADRGAAYLANVLNAIDRDTGHSLYRDVSERRTSW